MFFNNDKPPRAVEGAQGLVDGSNVKRIDTKGDIAAQATAFPPGLIGEVARYMRSAAPHPNDDIALAGAIAFMAGICGKAYNTYTGAGLNQYILLLASTGMGKEAASNGISKLFTAIIASVPAAGDFKGPALVSSAGLLKWLPPAKLASPRLKLETVQNVRRELARIYREARRGELKVEAATRLAYLLDLDSDSIRFAHILSV